MSPLRYLTANYLSYYVSQARFLVGSLSFHVFNCHWVVPHCLSCPTAAYLVGSLSSQESNCHSILLLIVLLGVPHLLIG